MEMKKVTNMTPNKLLKEKPDSRKSAHTYYP